MAREEYDPFKDEAVHLKKPRNRPVMIDWKRAARLLAGGMTSATVAAELGIEEDRLWRHLHKSARFRFLLAQAAEQRRAAVALQTSLAGPAAIRDRLQQPESLDGETLRSLMAQDQAVPVPDAGAATGQVDRLAAAGRPAPNLALRARLAAEKRRMDARVAAMQAEFAARFPAVGAEAGCGAEAERSETNTNEAERSVTNADEAKRSITNTNEAKRSETNASEAGPAEPAAPETMAGGHKPASPADPAARTRPDNPRPDNPRPIDPWPGRPPRHLVPTPPEPRSRAALLGTIVDLEGPDLARIRAMGGFDPPESADADGPAGG